MILQMLDQFLEIFQGLKLKIISRFNKTIKDYLIIRLAKKGKRIELCLANK